MKRTLSGSRARKAIQATDLAPHEMRTLTIDLEPPAIPLEARKHVEYLGRFPASHVYEWVELWQKYKATGEHAIVSRSQFHLLHDDANKGKLDIIEELPISFETPRAISRNTLKEYEHEDGHPLRLALRPEWHTSPTDKDSHLLREHSLPLYPCSFCDRTFTRKGVWKRHEESLHEPQKQWCCRESGCNRKFTAGDKLRQHHKTDQGCKDCKHNRKAGVVSIVQTKSARGCGFCVTHLTTWDERAKHLGRHFDSGSKRSDWDFTEVILGLLRQPRYFATWQSLLYGIYGPMVENWRQLQWSVESAQVLLETLQHPRSEQSPLEVAQEVHSLVVPDRIGSKLPAPLDHFLASAADQDFPVAQFSHDAVLPMHSDTLVAHESIQPKSSSLTLGIEMVDGMDGYGEYFQDSKDYTTPCAETFEPTAWTLWP